MPYKVSKVKGGFKATSPNHPKGFSKKPQTKAKARAQQKALYANAPDTTALRGLVKDTDNDNE
jgi:hypothetical protein